MFRLSIVIATTCVVLPIWAQQIPAGPAFGIHNETFTVRLLSPISTKTANVGDTFTAVVLSPEGFASGIVEGRVANLKRPHKGFGDGKSEVQLEFDTLSWSGRTERISAELRDVTNSLGVKNVDDEGRVIAHSSNKKRMAGAAGGAGVGALIGVMHGGLEGGIVGAATGGLAGYFITAKLTSTSSDIEFRPGSVFTLQVSDLTSRRPISQP